MQLLALSDVENAVDDPERAARLSGLVDRERTERTLVIGCGDDLGPSLLSNETDGRALLALYEAVDPDYCTFGNHDFDQGPAALRGVVADAPATWLTANLVDGDSGEPIFAGAGVRRWAVETVDGERVGLFGLTDPETLASTAFPDRFEVCDPIPAARDAVDEIRTAEVDRIVAISHLGDPDDDLRAAVDVDAVLGGHTHARRAEVIDGTAMTRPGERGEAVARVRLGSEPTAELLETDAAPIDEALANRLRAERRDLGLDETVATADDPIPRTRSDRFPESTVGNLVADAVRTAADAEVAVVNPGLLRAGPPLSGAVSEGDLRSIAPFENDVYVAPIDGAALRALFAERTRVRHDVPEVTVHVSGATLRWERTADSCRLRGASVDGEPIDPERTYRIASTSYPFYAPSFPQLDPDRATAVCGQGEAVVEYARSAGLPTGPEGRIVAEADALDGSGSSLS